MIEKLQTGITKLLGIDYPIVQGGMHYVGLAGLASAVSNAGGLGTITTLTLGSPARLSAEIAKCRSLTDRPFAVNLTFLPSVSPPGYPGLVDVIVESGVKVVKRVGNDPSEYLPKLKANSIKVLHKCTSIKHALKAQEIGCDALSIDGFECGGHPGEDDIPNMILLPRAADELEVPFIASGGITDGRSLVAALSLGAQGINMGTRFITTQEAPVHEDVKAAILKASDLDTRLVMRPLRNTERVLSNTAVEKLLKTERAKCPSLSFSDIAEHVAGVYPSVMQSGEVDAGARSCGFAAGLFDDVPSVRELTLESSVKRVKSLNRKRCLVPKTAKTKRDRKIL